MKGQERQAKIKDTNKSKHKQKEPKICSRKDYKKKKFYSGLAQTVPEFI